MQSLHISNCSQLQDLTPLEGMKLTLVTLTPKTVSKGMDGLRRMRSLTQLGLHHGDRRPVAEFWKRYDAGEFTK